MRQANYAKHILPWNPFLHPRCIACYINAIGLRSVTCRMHLFMNQDTAKHDWIETETKSNDPNWSTRWTKYARFPRIFTSLVKHISVSTALIFFTIHAIYTLQLYLIQCVNTIGICVQ
jgi:hypothetical protein